MEISRCDTVQAVRFFNQLFKPYPDGFIEIRPLKAGVPGRRTTYRLPHCLRGGEAMALASHCTSLADRGYDVYCGVLPRIEPEGPGRKLGKDACTQVACAWIDLDSKVPGSGQEILDSCQIVVSTGNGYHGYMLFASILHVTTKRDQVKTEAAIRSRANGLLPGTDNVSNLDRILRVPGTVNWKDRDNPKPVTLLRCPGIIPRARVSVWHPFFSDLRLDGLLASAVQGELEPIIPMLRLPSGRRIGNLNACIEGLYTGLKRYQRNPETEKYLLAMAYEDVPPILDYIFGVKK